MVDKADKVTGGCLCGAVRYEAEVYLKTAHYCHCRMCQRSSGAPAEIGVTVKPGSLAFTTDEPTYYQSSPFARRGFCRLCGSSLVWEAPSRPDWTNLSVGSLDHPEEVMPSQHIHVDSQLPWYQLDDGLPRIRSDEDPELAAASAETAESRD
jgi:hypothetical protein